MNKYRVGIHSTRDAIEDAVINWSIDSAEIDREIDTLSEEIDNLKAKHGIDALEKRVQALKAEQSTVKESLKNTLHSVATHRRENLEGVEGLVLRTRTYYDYDENDAVKWAVERKDTNMLRIHAGNFRKFVSSDSVPDFVKVETRDEIALSKKLGELILKARDIEAGKKSE